MVSNKKLFGLFGALVVSVVVLAMLVPTTARADYAPVTVNGGILLNYDQTVDVVHPINMDADATSTQFNHEIDVNAKSVLVGNRNLGEVNVDVVGAGNVADVVLGDTATVVQGVQESNISASSVARANSIPVDEVFVDVTALGNQSSVESGVVSNTQFVYDSAISARSEVSLNGFGVLPLDPLLNTTAIGNTASLIGDDVANYQLNRNVSISAESIMRSNRGAIGPVELNTKAIGNAVTIR